MISGSFYATLAGCLAAAASVCAKLSLCEDDLREMCKRQLSRVTGFSGSKACDWLQGPLRLICGGLLFACNAVMWAFFSKALKCSSSSAVATIATTSSNFISSAILGRLIFGETHAASWWMGFSFILCGLLVLQTATPKEDEKKM